MENLSETSQVLFFSILVNSLYFLADVFIKLASLDGSSFRLLFIRSVFTLLLCYPLFLLTGEPLQATLNTAFFQLFGCALLNAFGLFAYIKALQKAHFANVSILGLLGALIHYLLALFWQNQPASSLFYLATVFCLAGVAVQWQKSGNNEGLIWAIASAIAWGFGYALLSIPLQSINSSTGTFVCETAILLVSLPFIKKNWLNNLHLKNSAFLFLIALFTIAGSYFLYISYARFNLNLMGFMQLSFFPYSLLAGSLVFKEKLKKQEIWGLFLTGIGMLVFFLFC